MFLQKGPGAFRLRMLCEGGDTNFTGILMNQNASTSGHCLSRGPDHMPFHVMHAWETGTQI